MVAYVKRTIFHEVNEYSSLSTAAQVSILHVYSLTTPKLVFLSRI